MTDTEVLGTPEAIPVLQCHEDAKGHRGSFGEARAAGANGGRVVWGCSNVPLREPPAPLIGHGARG